MEDFILSCISINLKKCRLIVHCMFRTLSDYNLYQIYGKHINHVVDSKIMISTLMGTFSIMSSFYISVLCNLKTLKLNNAVI